MSGQGMLQSPSWLLPQGGVRENTTSQPAWLAILSVCPCFLTGHLGSVGLDPMLSAQGRCKVSGCLAPGSILLPAEAMWQTQSPVSRLAPPLPQAFACHLSSCLRGKK